MAHKSLTTYSASQQLLTWRELAETLLRRRGLILQVTGWGAILFTLLALARAPQYSTSAKLVVNPRIVETPVSAEPNSSASRGTDYKRVEAQMHSAVAMLTSPDLVKAALRNMQDSFAAPSEVDGVLDRIAGRIAGVVHLVLGLPNKLYARLHGVAPISGTDAMVGTVLGALKVTPIDNSDLIEITYTGEDPRWTAGLVNSLMQAYLNPAERTGDGGASLRFFQEQRAVLEGKLAEAQAALRKFRESDASDLAFADEQELRSVRLNLQAAKAQADTELSAVNAEVDALQTETRQLSRTLPVGAQVAQTGPITQLKTQVMQLELEKTVVGTKYAAGSVAVRDIETRLARARELLAAETRHATSTFQEGGAEMEKLTMDMVAARTHKAEVTARVTTLATQIDDYTHKLDRLDDVSAEYKKLATNLDAATVSHSNYLRKEEEARFAGELNDSTIMNVAVASSASVPVLPDPSAMWLTILFGTVLSFGAGAGIAVLRDRVDPTVKSPFEAERIAALPVISLLAFDTGSGARPSHAAREESFRADSSVSD